MCPEMLNEWRKPKITSALPLLYHLTALPSMKTLTHQWSTQGTSFVEVLNAKERSPNKQAKTTNNYGRWSPTDLVQIPTSPLTLSLN